MKKSLTTVFIAAMLAAALSGCGSKEDAESTTPAAGASPAAGAASPAAAADAPKPADMQGSMSKPVSGK